MFLQRKWSSNRLGAGRWWPWFQGESTIGHGTIRINQGTWFFPSPPRWNTASWRIDIGDLHGTYTPFWSILGHLNLKIRNLYIYPPVDISKPWFPRKMNEEDLHVGWCFMVFPCFPKRLHVTCGDLPVKKESWKGTCSSGGFKINGVTFSPLGSHGKPIKKT